MAVPEVLIKYLPTKSTKKYSKVYIGKGGKLGSFVRGKGPREGDALYPR
jgi:hypothetical protein